MYYKRKTSSQQKSKVSQAQVEWLMMELQLAREQNEKLHNTQSSQAKPAGNN
jgi:hypothetical protein